MSTLGGDPGKKEKQRLCPSCRMAISALATRCHYCGEEVARPKVEDRKLTIQDLGGHGQNQFRLSGSVLDALEAFRMEEGVSATPAPEPKKGLLRKSGQNQDGAQTPGPMLQSDTSQNTALLDEMGLAPRRPTQVQRRDPSWVTKIGVLGGFIAGIVILFFGGVKGFAMISNYLEARNKVPVTIVENRAPEILARGGDVVEALEAAMKSLRANPTDENEDIAAQVRRAVAKRIDDRLNDTDWSRQDLTEASRIAQQAARIDSNELINGYLKMTNEETAAYLMTVRNIDVDAKTATFARGAQDVVMVKEGQPFWGRFILNKVQRDGVYIIDPVRNNRRLWYSIDGVIRQAK